VRVGVVGAGVAGLAAARKIQQAGHVVAVFEASDRPGGRAATYRIGPYIFDHGATSVAPRGMGIEQEILEVLDTVDLVEITRPIHVHEGRRTFPGSAEKNSVKRYTYRQGIEQLGVLLCEGLDVRFRQPIEKIEKPGDGGYVLDGVHFDAVVVTPPVPEARELLPERRPLDNATYRQVISIMLAYDQPLDRPFHALIDPEQVVPLTWLSIESLKSPGRAPEGHTALVAQMSANYSRMRWEAGEDLIYQETLVDVSRLLGQEFARPIERAIHRWQHAQPEQTAIFERVNPPGATLVVAGDGTMGGRIELAYESGLKAAERLLA
jgi:predicted NAD/FAD-dependent oxidoreductase